MNVRRTSRKDVQGTIFASPKSSRKELAREQSEMVARFEPNIEGTQYDTGPYPVMEETDNGKYVRFSDYMKLKIERDALLAALG